jgi:hypothetical protein
MSLSTEQLEQIIAQSKKGNEAEKTGTQSTPDTVNSQEPTSATEEPASTEDKKSDEKDVKPSATEEPEKSDKADNPADDKDPKKDEQKSGTEPSKSETPKKSDNKPADKKSQIDYAFAKQKAKSKELKKKVKELEEELRKYKDLRPEHFKKDDGSQDVQGYMDYRINQENVKKEIDNLNAEDASIQEQMEVERDRYITEHSFHTEEEKNEYVELVRNNLPQFVEDLKQADPEGVVLNYLGSLNQYPVVLKTLLTDMNKLSWLFRSHDPQALRSRIERLSDDLLDEYNSKKAEPQPAQTTVQNVAPVPPKNNIPVTGRQVTSSTGSSNPVVKDRNWWNEYLRTHR